MNETTLSDLVVRETPESFFLAVENLVWEHEISYWDALVKYTESKGEDFDYESVKTLVSDRLRELIERELSSVNLLKKKKLDVVPLDV